MMRSIACTVYADEARTLVVPAQLAGDYRRSWLVTALSTVNAATTHWDPAASELIPDILNHAIDTRGGNDSDVLVLQLWSERAPAFCTVRVAAEESPGLGVITEQLRNAGDSRVEQITAASIGVGREWIFDAALPGQEGTQLLGLQSCFADDELLVTITLEATLPDIFVALVEEVREIIAGMEIEVGGRPWRAGVIGPHVGTRRDQESWPQLREKE